MGVRVTGIQGADTRLVELRPGTCREVVMELGLAGQGANDFSFRVLDQAKNDVSDLPFKSFDGKYLTVAPKENIGGWR